MRTSGVQSVSTALAGEQRVLSFESSAVAVRQVWRSRQQRLLRSALAEERRMHNSRLSLNLLQDDQTYLLVHNNNHELTE